MLHKTATQLRQVLVLCNIDIGYINLKKDQGYFLRRRSSGIGSDESINV